LTCPKERRVVRHMEHAEKAEAPGVSWRRSVLDQNGHAAVNLFGELRIPAGAHYLAGVRVGVEKDDVLCSQRVSARLVLKKAWIRKERGELRHSGRGSCAKYKDTEIDPMVDAGK